MKLKLKLKFGLDRDGILWKDESKESVETRYNERSRGMTNCRGPPLEERGSWKSEGGIYTLHALNAPRPTKCTHHLERVSCIFLTCPEGANSTGDTHTHGPIDF